MSLSLDNLKAQLQAYTVQRDQAQVNFQQLSGAIHVLTSLIADMEKLPAPELAPDQEPAQIEEVEAA